MKTIAICGSMYFSQQMVNAKKTLEERGFKAMVPLSSYECALDENMSGRHETFLRKINQNAIYRHYVEIQKADAILVLNYDKNGIENYIGANTFLEMGFAHVLSKRIYVLNPLPNMNYLMDELKAFNVIILNGELKNIS